MAEDIVGNWDNIKDFAVGLGLAGIGLLDNGVVTPEKFNDLLKPILQLADALRWSREGLESWSGPMQFDTDMVFRLEDSEGREVSFPLKLICDTRYMSLE